MLGVVEQEAVASVQDVQDRREWPRIGPKKSWLYGKHLKDGALFAEPGDSKIGIVGDMVPKYLI